MRTKAVFLFVLLFPAVACAAATEAPEEALRDVAGISYRGIGFSSSPPEMRRLLPNAVLNTLHPGQAQGINTYEVRDDANYDCVLLRFANGVLIEIDYINFPKRVAAKGGVQTLRDQATEMFGDPATRTDQTLLWDFPKLNRMIVAFDANGKWSLHVYDRARRLALHDYKDTTVAVNESPIQIAVGPAVPYQPPTTNAVPSPVMTAIQEYALLDHPADRVTQDYVVGKQLRSYQEMENYSCPRGMRPHVFEYLVGRVKRDHPDDFSTQLYVLDRQVAAYEEIRSMRTPEGVAGSHFYALRKDAARRHPYDYSTQLYVLQRDIDEYLQYRMSGNSGGAILEYLLKD